MLKRKYKGSKRDGGSTMREPDKEHLLMHGFAPAGHASVFRSVSVISANPPALVQWRFVCICVCLSAPLTRLLLSLPRPQHSGLCGQTMPTTNLTSCMFQHLSFTYVFYALSLSLSSWFGWLNVYASLGIYYYGCRFCIYYIGFEFKLSMFRWGSLVGFAFQSLSHTDGFPAGILQIN